MHLNVHAKQRIIARVLRISLISSLVTALILTALLVALTFMLFTRGPSEMETIQSFKGLAVTLFATLAACISTYGVHRSMLSPRRFRSGLIDSALFFEIADVLHERGIRSVRRFIKRNPLHLQAAVALQADLRQAGHADHDSIAAIVFTGDNDPWAIRDAVFEAANTRGLKDANQIRGLLESSARVSSPLMEGAL